MKIFRIYDKKSETFGRPFSSATRGTALRELMSNLTEPNNPLAEYPEDYTLYEVGECSDTIAPIDPYPAGDLVVELVELTKEPTPDARP